MENENPSEVKEKYISTLQSLYVLLHMLEMSYQPLEFQKILQGIERQQDDPMVSRWELSTKT